MGYSERLERAFAFAAERHRDQVRKGTAVPYVTHLMAVAAIVGEHGGSEDQVIAALLHDAMEDQGVTREELTARFGEVVAALVEACSDTTEQPKPPWRARKERYVAHLRAAAPEVKLLSAADKVHNAGSILRDLRAHGESVWSRFRAGPEETLWYYRAVLAALREGGPQALVDELERLVDAIEALRAARSPPGS